MSTSYGKGYVYQLKEENLENLKIFVLISTSDYFNMVDYFIIIFGHIYVGIQFQKTIFPIFC